MMVQTHTQKVCIFISKVYVQIISTKDYKAYFLFARTKIYERVCWLTSMGSGWDICSVAKGIMGFLNFQSTLKFIKYQK